MLDVSLVYDPVSPDNRSIEVNGKKLEKPNELAVLSQKMLQTWIHKLPGELKQRYQGENVIDLTFAGTESDLQDVEKMVRQANEQGFKITFKQYKAMPSPQEKFGEFRNWLDEQYDRLFFKKLLEEHPDKKAKIDEALGDRFDIYVVATMSSGKSTLINAFLHKELMPSANEATTAVITEIKNVPRASYAGTAYRGTPGASDAKKMGGPENVTLETMGKWNRHQQVDTISLEGPLPFVMDEKNLNVVLTDTPGPNNSRDESHGVITMAKIKDNKKKPLILYVLNSEQMGINDDRRLLEEIGRVIKDDPQARDRFLFVLNKADAFDPEKGEDIDRILGQCRDYLEGVGIESPFIYPVSARLALLSRKKANPVSSFTRQEKGDLTGMETTFLPDPESNWPGIDLSEKAPTTFSVAIDRNNELACRSGITALEAAIKGYARKYNYSFRLHRLASVAKEVLEIGRSEEQFVKLISESGEKIKKIRNAVERLRNESTKVWESQSFLDELKQREELPQVFVKAIQEKRTEREMFLNTAGRRLTGLDDVSRVNSELNSLMREFKGYFQTYLAFLNGCMEDSNQQIAAELESFYAEKIKAVFAGLDDGTMNRPLWSALENVTFSMDMKLDSSEVVKEARKVSTSRWWNPFSWGSEKEVYDYKVGNVNAVWNQRALDVSETFDDATSRAEEKILTYRADYVELFKERVNKLLPEKLDELDRDIEKRESDAAEQARAQAEAEKNLEEIRAIRGRLDEILNKKS
ncbi:dynamin family protein [Bombella favorum]|uniref:Dynamin N-terminal domain-containing protein n=1 Tax=Bombella favorum TaxID=2039164 RepID=A0ABR5ZNP2_9PROT|nr:dynamin family protein [Bombella favorum]MBA5725858.1 hypothetical protein [Bombella favorum]